VAGALLSALTIKNIQLVLTKGRTLRNIYLWDTQSVASPTFLLPRIFPIIKTL